MKAWPRLFMAFVLLAAAAPGAQPVGAGAGASQPAPPIIRVEAGAGEYRGRVTIGQTVTREAVVTNVSGVPIRLHVVKTTCSCVTAEIDEAVIPAGRQAKARISVAVSGGVGLQRHGAEIEARTDAPNGPRQHLALMVEYEPDRAFEVRPGALRVTAVADEPFDIEVFLTRRTPGSLDVTNAFLEIAGTREPLDVTGDATTLTRRLRWHGTRPEGTSSGFITFETSSARTPSLAVPVYVRVLPAWEPTPAGVVLRATEAATISFTLAARHPGDSRHPAGAIDDEGAVDARFEPGGDSDGKKVWRVTLAGRESRLSIAPQHRWITISDQSGGSLCRVLFVRLHAPESTLK